MYGRFFLRLVTEDFLSDQAARPATGEAEEEEHGFGDAPALVLGGALVEAVADEAGEAGDGVDQPPVRRDRHAGGDGERDEDEGRDDKEAGAALQYFAARPGPCFGGVYRVTRLALRRPSAAISRVNS